MKATSTPLAGLSVIEPRVFEDPRGFFLETFNAARYEALGIPAHFVQDNWSRSQRGTLRGLHFQHPRGQGKLVWVPRGAVWDVAVDVRQGSATFGRWFGVELSEVNKKQLWIPPGFAHGFCTLEPDTLFAYKVDSRHAPEAEAGLPWNDPAFAIPWPTPAPFTSARDESHAPFAHFKTPFVSGIAW